MSVVDELEERFVEVAAAAREALAEARAEPWVKGSRGQLVAHPGFSVAAKLQLVAVRLAAELRMSRRQGSAKPPRDELDELARHRREQL